MLLAEIRAALVKYGLAVAATDGFKAWDLNIVLPPAVRVPLNALRQSDGTLALAWRTKTEPTRTIIAAAVVFIALIACGLSAIGAIGGTAAVDLDRSRARDHSIATRAVVARRVGRNDRQSQGLKAAVHPGETF